MRTTCSHIEQIAEVKQPRKRQCEECVAIGSQWVQLIKDTDKSRIAKLSEEVRADNPEATWAHRKMKVELKPPA